MMMMMYFRAHECIVGNWTAWDGWRWVYALLTPLTDLFLSSCAGLTKSVTPNAFPAVDSSRAHFSSDSNNNNLMQEEEVSFAWHAIKNGRDQQLAKFLLVRVQVNADYLGRSTHFRTLCHLKKKVGFHKFRPDLVPFYKHKLLLGKIDQNGELVQRVFFPSNT